MKKGAFSKHWVEIIGGIVCVVIILAAIIFLTTAASTATEEINNRMAFRSFKEAMGNVMREETHTIAPFELSTRVYRRSYKITYPPQELIECWKNPRGDNCGDYYLEISSGKSQLEKCYAGAYYSNDLCLCLISITTSKSHYTQSFFKVEEEEDLQTTINENIKDCFWDEYLKYYKEISDYIEDVKILSCDMVIGDIGCVFRDSRGHNMPCLLRHNDDIIVSIAAWKSGRVFGNRDFYQEALSFRKESGQPYIDVIISSSVHSDVTLDCKLCGGIGQRCCEGDLCNDWLICEDGECVRCGDAGQICCENNECIIWRMCENGECVRCGYADHMCCPGGICSAGHECENGECVYVPPDEFD